MKMASGTKLAFALLVLALGLPSTVLGAPAGWLDGRITFYGTANGGGTQAGACGYQNTYALGYGSMTAALSSALFQNGAACGACYQITCAPPKQRGLRNWCWSYSRSIVITATNLCPSNTPGTPPWCNPPNKHFDLTQPAFITLAKREAGVADVFFRRVRCAKRGGIRFTIGGNPYFAMILIHNVGGAGDIRAVSVKGTTTGWYPLVRNWGQIWTCKYRIAGPMTFMITTSDGRSLVARNAIGAGWKFGQTWEGPNFSSFSLFDASLKWRTVERHSWGDIILIWIYTIFLINMPI